MPPDASTNQPPMQIRDLSQDSEIGELTSLLRRVSQATQPWEIQKEFGKSMRERISAEGYISVSIRNMPRETPQPYRITRMQFGGEIGKASATPWTNPEELPVGRGGFLGSLIETPTPKLIHNMRVANDPVLGNRLAGMGSCVAVPLFDNGEALNWAITFREDPTSGSPEEVDEFLLRGNLIGGMTRTLLVSQQVNQLNEQLVEQLEQIAQIQRSLLPSEVPKIPGLNIATSYLTSNHAGGDYYDFFDMGKDRLGVMIADVSGHGAGAATVMAMLQTILHGYQEREKGPAAMLEHANRQLLHKRVESNFVTAFFGVLDSEQRCLRYANAGHNRPLLHTRAGSILEIDGAASLPLGIIDEPEYEDDTHALEGEDTVVLYTDGITEAFGPPPEKEMFGTERLVASLQHCTGHPECVIDSIHTKLHEHTGSLAREDDQTIVALRVEG